ncbi:MAG: tryptophan--tRNA ligase [Lachnospiraceae bacterium]|nr:tryptophan--tRNA ligase [Lachnospiraceae bacterium]
MSDKKKIILTGDRPTGKLHVGHYVGSLRRRVELQNSGEFDEIFIMIADAQALTDNARDPQKIRDSLLNVTLDYLSAGIDPAKSHILIQSMIPALPELTAYYMNLVTVQRVGRNPTVKSEIKMRGFSEGEADNEEGTPVGFFCYPISQAADITAFDATVVPVGEDQEPMLEQTREIVRKFNSIYGETLVLPDILLPGNLASRRLPGTDGKAKMSKSLGNCIYLSDDEAAVSAAVKTMFTDPTHLKVTDPGHTEDNPVFIYLEAFAGEDNKDASALFAEYAPDYKDLNEMEEHYRRGGLGDVKVKKFLDKVLQETLSPIRKRRAEYEKDIPAVYEILKEGTAYAAETAANTLSRVKRVMGIDYFRGM